MKILKTAKRQRLGHTRRDNETKKRTITVKVKVFGKGRKQQHTSTSHITQYATLETRFVPYVARTVHTLYTVDHLMGQQRISRAKNKYNRYGRQAIRGSWRGNDIV